MNMDSNSSVTFKAPAWAVESNEELGEVDEPPEIRNIQSRNISRTHSNFTRNPIRRPSEQSTLTKAIAGTQEEEAHVLSHAMAVRSSRRRSMTSNISVASTADLTSDTGFTSPARTNTPSPPLPEMAMLRLHGGEHAPPKAISLLTAAVKVEGQTAPAPAPTSEPAKPAPRKRCIQFACGGAKPAAQPAAQPAAAPQSAAMTKAPSAQEAPRKPCIKFACPARPASTQNTPPRQHMQTTQLSALKIVSPATPKKTTPASSRTSSPRAATPRRMGGKMLPSGRPRFLRANSSDLGTDGSQFHEFASEMSREDDWIRDEAVVIKTKLTIDDTLVKENDIRRLAREAEEEAAAEDDEDDDGELDEDDEDDDLDEEVDEDEDEDDDDNVTVEEFDGYSTDEETGFADSDESADEDDDNMALWTLGGTSNSLPSSQLPVVRRPSLREQQSDSSTASNASARGSRRVKPQRIQIKEDVSDLPDSTDFVCGTLDEDKPLEEAYLSRLAARRNEKLRIIPQDIDPSFPASDPEDEADEELFNPVYHDSDEEIFMHGEMEDIHHGQDRSRRRKKDHASPKKYHSPPPPRHRHHSPPPKHRLHSPPPPKHRHHSPPPKHRHYSPPPRVRGKSPKPLFDRMSPRGARVPTPNKMTTPTGSPRLGAHLGFNLAGRPGLTDTKSLPRPAAMFCHKQGRSKHLVHDDDVHIRGAIDIVKGLEKKRLRRKEKFDRNYCKRARRGQIPERKALPGLGAERMKELGLLMAGKKDQTNYVLSI